MIVRSANKYSAYSNLEESVVVNQLNSGELPPQVNDLLAVLFTDNYYLENVESFDGNDTVICKFMKRHKEGCSSYWTWPLRKDDVYSIHKDAVLPVKPRIDVFRPLSSNRNIVFALKK